MEDHQGTIWIGTYGGGLNSFNMETEQFTIYKRNKNVPGSISNNRILALHEDSNGDIWIGTRSGGLNRYDNQQINLKSLYLIQMTAHPFHPILFFP